MVSDNFAEVAAAVVDAWKAGELQSAMEGGADGFKTWVKGALCSGLSCVTDGLMFSTGQKRLNCSCPTYLACCAARCRPVAPAFCAKC